MKQIIIIGAGLGLNGCQMLRMQAESMQLAEDLAHAMQKLQDVTMNMTSNLEMYKDTMLVAEKAKNDFYISLDVEKSRKQKYIRQQHKLAQIHYRRK